MQTHSFRFEVNNKPTRYNKYTVFLCITVGGTRKRIKTPVEVNDRDDFNMNCKNNKWIRRNVPESAVLNDQLSKILENARRKFSELDSKENVTVTTDKVVEKINEKNHSESFIEFMKSEQQKIYNSGSIGVWKKYNILLNKLTNYLNGKDLLMSDINIEFVRDFDDYLHTLHNERQPEKLLHPNAIHELLKNLRAYVNKAITAQKMRPENNPFLVYRLKLVATTKEKLTESEILDLESVKLEKGSLQWHVRNIFMFSFYCAGIRASDVLQLRWSNINEGRLAYQMGKNHKVRDLVLVDQANKILGYYKKKTSLPTDYIFPFFDSNSEYAKYISMEDKDSMPLDIKKDLFNKISGQEALINKELGYIKKKAGITKKVTMHVSRHSFAKIAKDKGTDNSAIQNMLAHSSLSITERYMGGFDTEATDNALKKIFTNGETAKQKLIHNLVLLVQDEDEKFIKKVCKDVKKAIEENRIRNGN